MNTPLPEKMTLKGKMSEGSHQCGLPIDEMGDFRAPEARIEDRNKYYSTLAPGFGESFFPKPTFTKICNRKRKWA